VHTGRTFVGSSRGTVTGQDWASTLGALEGKRHVDLYRSKTVIVGALDPVLGGLERRRVGPDALTLAAIPVAAAAAACLLASPAIPALLLAVPVLALVRLVLNLLDGALARRTGRIHARGEFYNEVGDRVADLLFIVPVAFLPGAQLATVLLGALGAILASYAGLTVRAAGGPRVNRGILSKPGRMVLVSAFALGALLFGPGTWAAFGPLLLIGTVLTLLERVVVALRELD
jgi:phosphatidylglycerophosphate synthase